MSPLYVSTLSPLWDGLAPLLRRAREVDIAVAYATVQGALLLRRALERALGEGASVRLLVGCYLGGTRPDALRELLALDHLGARVLFIADPQLHFHPKVYRIVDGDGFEHLFVGSSNLSRSALLGGPRIHEWTLGLERAQAGSLLDEAREHLEHLFASLGQRLTLDEIARFEQEQALHPTLPPAALLDPEEPPGVFVLTPNEAQQQALASLDQARQQGHRRALVVAATGLGKTLLAAFDSQRVVPAGGRILVVAHRRSLLDQAASAFGKVRGEQESQGFVDQVSKQKDADQVYASVWSLDALSDDELRAFDYVVVDEAHHGAAASYRRLFEVASPRFLLGLTATPERLDGADVYGLFHGVVACEVQLLEGIQRGWLAPFVYHGVHDPVDYDRLSWTGGKLGYAPAQLDAALLSAARTGVLLAQLGDPRVDAFRTLVFCISIAHAMHTAAALVAAGWKVAQVHSGSGALVPAAAIDALRRGHIQVIVAVDMFNEGVDLPEVDRILMLRPTDSPAVFLQQLGRGLRKAPGKERLLVIDLVGNHRRAVQKLAWLGVGGSVVRNAPAGQPLRVRLLGGSEVSLDVEALDAVQAVSRALGGPRARLRDAVLRLTEQAGQRPSLTELLSEVGLSLTTLRALFGSWLELLSAAECLSAADRRLQGSPTAVATLEDVESTGMSGPHKMLLLGAMAQARRTTLSFSEARDLCPGYASTFDASLWSSLDARSFPAPFPVDKLVTAHGSWCHREGNVFSLSLPPGIEAELLAAIAERAEARLRAWLWTRRLPAGIQARILRNGASLCLMLGEENARKLGPTQTWIGLRLEGEIWFGKLMKGAINILRREPADGVNQSREAVVMHA
ncbi:MAG: DEAD/DEAH box helicase family protein [Polyangiaceae bacterium]|jgi:superfamily II DNA or RNA helicase/HKD family nuclease|nr:DEAD/DEAH box helicase family protein [Polyangiaceae bacterium]